MNVDGYSEILKASGSTHTGACTLQLALHDLIVCNDASGCDALIRDGRVDVNRPFRFSQSAISLGRRLVCRDIEAMPLHVACIYRRAAVLEVLLRHGARPNMRDHLGRVALQLVIQYWPRIMYKSEDEVKSLPKEERTFNTHLKRQHEQAERALELLCQNGGCVNWMIRSSGETLLHLAAKYNIISSVQHLTRFGARLDESDHQRLTPLLRATEVANDAVAIELVLCGACVNATDAAFKTPLHYACASDGGNSKLIALLLSRDAWVNFADSRGNTSLHVAAFAGREDVVEMLLSFGATPDAVNRDGELPLFRFLDNVANLRRIYGLELLLQNTVGIHGFTQLHRSPALLDMDEFADLREALERASLAPASLQRMCRLCVRRALGPTHLREGRVDELPCGHGLKQLILFNTNDWW
ncbi:Ankyrin repeat domain-containing protein 61 [Lamellibrachia satsuma]|nr:Ankyrin repeat domain-containing protein 61 [Lamellibrachia satsuma]